MLLERIFATRWYNRNDFTIGGGITITRSPAGFYALANNHIDGEL